MSDERARAELAELRELIVGADRARVDRLEKRLDEPALLSSDVARVLPEAIGLRAGKPDGRLERAVTPLIESALVTSVKKDPQVIADALYPVMGPAIRKAIAETFNTLVQGMNAALEHSFSVRGLAWRLEAARTGVSFGDVVMRHSILYRVEQVFLIHEKTGLPIEHLAAAEVLAQDSSMVSGMLAAIQDFARDSFAVGAGEGLSTMKVGELTVWIEQGPMAILAVVIRGSAPETLHATMHDVLREVHVTFADQLGAFDGDTAPLEPTRELLARCVGSEVKGAGGGEKNEKRGAPTPLYVIGLLLVGGAGWFAYSAWDSARRIDDFVGAVRATPGVVLQSVVRAHGRIHLEGLRDPLARDPVELAAKSGLDPSRVDARWEPYQALTPAFILTRVKGALAAPAGVRVDLRPDGVVVAEGGASRAWIRQARAIARVVPGVTAYDDSAVRDLDRDALAASAHAIDGLRLLFPKGAIEPAAGSASVVDEAARHILALLAAARRVDVLVSVSLVGHADAGGSEADNEILSARRADGVAAALRDRGVPGYVLTARGAGSREPRVDADANRRVEFRATIVGEVDPSEPAR